MSSRKRKKKGTDARDANFIACFIVHGGKPKGPGADLAVYKANVRSWWADMNKGMDPPMKAATAHRFWNRYQRWYENMMTNERRTDRVVDSIVKKWTDE